MHDRFPDYPSTDRARRIFELAEADAHRRSHEHIGTEHFLLGIIAEGGGVAVDVLRNTGIGLTRISTATEKLIIGNSTVTPICTLPLAPSAKKALELALEEASVLGHNLVGSEHLLLSMIKVDEGIAARVLKNFGLTYRDMREDVLDLLAGGPDEGERD